VLFVHLFYLTGSACRLSGSHRGTFWHDDIRAQVTQSPYVWSCIPRTGNQSPCIWHNLSGIRY